MGMNQSLLLKLLLPFPNTMLQKTPFLLDRMLSLLASFSLLNNVTTPNSTQRLYTLSPSGKYFVRNNAEIDGSLATFLLFSSEPVQRNAWLSLKDAIIEGVSPCEKAYGHPIFQVMSQHPEIGKLFNKAMSEVSTLTMKGLLETYKGFNETGLLVDVGGGDGSCLKMIISMNPHIKGINFDLPQVVQNAPVVVTGITHVGGNMFQLLPNGDSIMLKNVLHNWGDEHCLTLLKHCHDAIPSKGKVIVIEAILTHAPSANNESKDSCLRDANMFILPQGKERTRDEFISLCRASGFRYALFVCSYGIEWVIEFRK